MMSCKLQQVVSTPGNQQDHSELTAEDRHLAVLDVALESHDECGNFLNQADTVRTDCSQDYGAVLPEFLRE